MHKKGYLKDSNYSDIRLYGSFCLINQNVPFLIRTIGTVHASKDSNMKYVYFNPSKELFLKIGMNYLPAWYFDIEA